ncbi:MAG: hypothetical protein HYZ63_01990 [Candidatus Andersenbacteria bacterium]|nr:hypothetical protein [Candidatus Andersenbacteria bacterium]
MGFIQELKHLGLKDKEASVYLAALQLGPSSVQVIARKAKVVRATTYVILEDLQKKGLMTNYKEGKKTLFSAEPPLQLNRLLEKQAEEITEKKRDFAQVLPELQMLTKAAGGKPSVHYFEGKEGLRVIRQEIISTRSEKLKKVLGGKLPAERAERRYVPPKFFSSTSGLTIFRDRIAIGSFTGTLMGVIIESQIIADMMRQVFDLAWAGSSLTEEELGGRIKQLDKQKSNRDN